LVGKGRSGGRGMWNDTLLFGVLGSYFKIRVLRGKRAVYRPMS